ncbi:Siroheme decarboxylase NirG subunit [uncultured Gammaproteobacteria bacterium]
MSLDQFDRSLINRLQDGLPVCDRPYAAVGTELGLDESQVIARLERLLAEGTLTRFGPMVNAERMGGGLCLAALAVPEDRFDQVTALVNAFPEVAHNYARDHAWNMWFVIATDRAERVAEVVAEIEAATGLPVLAVPKLHEFYLNARFAA